MHAPQSLLQAALNRLGARLGSGFADSAANLAVLAQEAPERLRRELELFWSEVEQEAERLETEAGDDSSGGRDRNQLIRWQHQFLRLGRCLAPGSDRRSARPRR